VSSIWAVDPEENVSEHTPRSAGAEAATKRGLLETTKHASSGNPRQFRGPEGGKGVF